MVIDAAYSYYMITTHCFLCTRSTCTQAREHFCQLIQLIRNRLRADEDKDHISVFVGTFNMGDASPPVSLDSWLKSSGLGKTLPAALSQSHDMYVFGTQVGLDLFMELYSCYSLSLSLSSTPLPFSLPSSLHRSHQWLRKIGSRS